MLGDVHIGERASDLLDGRLSPDVERSLRTHLGGCPRCAELVRAEDQVRRLLRGSSQDGQAAPRDLMAGLMSLSCAEPAAGPMSMPAGRPRPTAIRQPGRRAKAGLLVAGAAITMGIAAPVALNAAPPLASLVPSSWLPQEPAVTQLVVVPAGPRGGAHTVLRVGPLDRADESDRRSPGGTATP